MCYKRLGVGRNTIRGTSIFIFWVSNFDTVEMSIWICGQKELALVSGENTSPLLSCL